MTFCVVNIKHVAFFIIWAKLAVAFTCTSLPLNLYTSVFGCGYGFGFEQIFWRIDGFSEKRHGSADLHTPIHPPPPPSPTITSIEASVLCLECLRFAQHRCRSPFMCSIIGTLRYTTAGCYYGYFGREGLG